MNPPDAVNHQPECQYIRELIAHSGLGTNACARRIGITPKSLRQMIDPDNRMMTPYTVQYALECLVHDQQE